MKTTKVTVADYKGKPVMFINGKPRFSLFDWLRWEGSAKGELSERAKEHIKAFRDRGIHLYFISLSLARGWVGPGRYDYTPMDREIKRLLELDPDAYVMLQMRLQTPPWWNEKHPDEMAVVHPARGEQEVATMGGGKTGPSHASLRYKEDMTETVLDCIRHIKGSPFRSRVMSYSVNSVICEWYQWGTWGLWPNGDYCRPNLEGFRRWLQQKYGGDVAALRKSWGEPKVTFENAEIPTDQQRDGGDVGDIKDPAKSEKVIDYNYYYSDVMADLIVYFCKLMKEELGDEALIGVPGGYCFGVYNHPNTGFLAGEKVFECNEIDFMWSTMSYINRRVGEAIISLHPLNSLKLRGKLWLNHDDTRMNFGDTDYAAPQDRQEVIAQLRRNAACQLAHDVGIFYCTGGDWYHDEVLLDDIDRMNEVCRASIEYQRDHQNGICVVVGYTSGHYLRQYVKGRSPLASMVEETAQFQLGKTGTGWDVYVANDLGRKDMPDYKMYLFLNVFHLTEEQRRMISEKVRRNNSTVVWLYAPGFADDKVLSLEHTCELMGMKLKYEVRNCDLLTRISDDSHPITKGLGTNYQFGRAILHDELDFPNDHEVWRPSPVFYVNDAEAAVLGRLCDGDQAGFCVKEFANWRSVYIASPAVPARLLREIARWAGVHIYNDRDDVLYVSNNFLVLQVREAGPRTIRLPKASDVYDVFEKRKVAQKTTEFSDDLPAKTTRVYFLGEQMP